MLLPIVLPHPKNYDEIFARLFVSSPLVATKNALEPKFYTNRRFFTIAPEIQ